MFVQICSLSFWICLFRVSDLTSVLQRKEGTGETEIDIVHVCVRGEGRGECWIAWVALGFRLLLFAIMVRDLELSQGNGDGEGGVLMRGEVGVGDFFEEDKENICVSLEDVVEPLLLHQRSPLPTGYLRSPLQDITAVLSSVNQTKEDEGECGRHKRPHQCRSQQKVLTQLCSPFVEEMAATSLQTSPFGQCTVLGCSERAGPSGSVDPVTQDLAQHHNTSNEITEQSRELWRLAEEKESEKQVKFKHVAAESVCQVKEHLVMMASKLSNGAGPASSSSQKTKRRKPFVKHILGQSVPRFQYPLRTALCHFSQPQVVWVVNSSEQDVCA